MFSKVDTKNPSAVEAETAAIYRKLFPKGDPALVRQAFEWAGQFFGGRYPGYLPVDALYHDYEHTLQGTLCLMRLLQARQNAGAKPQISQRTFEQALAAILFHDTGYLKTIDDTEGTGAKYTPTHVTRSGVFAKKFLSAKGWSETDIHAVQHMIRCTGVNVNIKAIHFQTPEERVAGFALATSDLLGQMAASNYVERLPELYLEFKEAAEFNRGKEKSTFEFKSADEMMSKTSAFWEFYVLPKINNEFEGLYRYLNDPYPDGPNEYIGHIEKNIARLQRSLKARSK